MRCLQGSWIEEYGENYEACSRSSSAAGEASGLSGNTGRPIEGSRSLLPAAALIETKIENDKIAHEDREDHYLRYGSNSATNGEIYKNRRGDLYIQVWLALPVVPAAPLEVLTQNGRNRAKKLE